jgi:sigma-B regulation protein RsbU (phosphoserine phosphatase)
MESCECRRSRSAIRILPAALCLGVLCSPLGLKAQTKPPPASAAAAQPFDASNLHVPARLGATGVFIGGDDPAFARTDYDDSKWVAADDKRPIHELLPDSKPEIVWQRIHVKVSPSQTGLGIEAWDVSHAFELYVNGQKLLESGQFNPLLSYTKDARLVARIPDAQIATGNLVIAIRAWAPAYWWTQSSKVDFFAEMITLGQETALSDHVVLGVIYPNAFTWLVALMGIGLSVVALALFVTQRQQKEYLWLALQGGFWAIGLPITITETFRNLPAALDYLGPLFSRLVDFFTILMIFAFVRRKLRGWLRVYIVLNCVCGVAIGWADLSGVALPASIYLLWIPFFAIFAIVIPAVLIAHLRRGNREESILLIPVISWGLDSLLQVTIAVMQAIPALHKAGNHLAQEANQIHLGPFVLDTGMVTSLIGFISLAIIIVQRSARTSRQQTLLEGEMAAAREIQQIILPEQIETIPGFTIESVYQPAKQVGGDFFQVLPAGEGGLLLVLGDVAGKGLPAAMLVSVLVGAIRATSEYTLAPATVLASLNERMIGRTKGGFSTALAAQIAADGTLTVANAGHLSPYLDGHEIELPGALPLGIVSGATYETTLFQLAPGSRLTFYSDGVVEARNQVGELFGFERAKAISTQPAAAIVEAAKQFGQEDDITVVTIERLEVVRGIHRRGNSSNIGPASEIS